MKVLENGTIAVRLEDICYGIKSFEECFNNRMTSHMPKCPVCGSEMKKDIAYQGPNKTIGELESQKYPKYVIYVCKNLSCSITKKGRCLLKKT